jgi:hypothetical protein
METIIASVIASLVGGALSKAKNLGVAAITGAYDGLKDAVVRELGGNTGAVQTLEEHPDSNTARTMLAEEFAGRAIPEPQMAQLQRLAEQLEAAISQAQADGVPRAGDINFADVRGKVSATVSGLTAAGSITFGSVVADDGSAVVSNLTAGVPAAREQTGR